MMTDEEREQEIQRRADQAKFRHSELYHLITCPVHDISEVTAYIDELSMEDLADLVTLQLGAIKALRTTVAFHRHISYN